MDYKTSVKKSILLLFMLIIVQILLLNSVGAVRGIKRIKDLTHTSGKIGSYKALIVGINDYKDRKIPDLATAVNDARVIADVLKNKYGFKIQTKDIILDKQATKKSDKQQVKKSYIKSRA